jgi:hypothetical protein
MAGGRCPGRSLSGFYVVAIEDYCCDFGFGCSGFGASSSSSGILCTGLNLK